MIIKFNRIMLITMLFIVSLILIMWSSNATGAELSNSQSELSKILIRNPTLTKFLLPKESAEPVDLEMKFYSLRIVKVDANNNKLYYSTSLSLIWNDSRLSWDSALYSDINLINLPVSEIWTPDIIPHRKKQVKFQYFDNQLAAISSKGRVKVDSMIETEMYCSNNKELLTCSETYSTMNYNGLDIDLLHEAGDLEYENNDAKWNVSFAVAEKENFSTACCPIYNVKLTIQIQSNQAKPINWTVSLIVITAILCFIPLNQVAARLIIASGLIIIASLCIAVANPNEYSIEQKKEILPSIWIATFVFIWTIVVSNILWFLSSMKTNREKNIEFLSKISMFCILPKYLIVRGSKSNSDDDADNNNSNFQQLSFGELIILLLDRLLAVILLFVIVIVYLILPILQKLI